MTPGLRNFLFVCVFVLLSVLALGLGKKIREAKSSDSLSVESSGESLRQVVKAQERAQEIDFSKQGRLEPEEMDKTHSSEPSVNEIAWDSLRPELSDTTDRLGLLFAPYGPQLPIVKTIRYSSRVDWLKGRSAWIVDYASHFATSKHFISRSLSGKKEYGYYEVSEGDKFNVLNPDIDLEFYLLVSLQDGQMKFYYVDKEKKDRVLLKVYEVGLGRRDEMSPSGCLTPIGKYRLGSRIAVYRPGMMGTFRKNKTEMVKVFGSRWIPFEEEINGCSAPAKGYGVHGIPWIQDESGQWSEDINEMEKYRSDGCLRLKKEDIEELFAIIITRPTTIEIVKQFNQAQPEFPETQPEIVMP